jgi:hypothetical protein
MIINLKQSVLFTVHPDVRFSKEYGIEQGLWREMYRRYKILDYTLVDLGDFYHVKTGKQVTKQTLLRWIWRTDVYYRANAVMEEGVEVVQSEFFGIFEYEVIKELLKNIKTSATQNSRTVI